MDLIIELAKAHGSIGLILAYFIVQEYQRRKDDRRREKLLGERLDLMVDEHNKTTKEVMADCAKGLQAAAAAAQEQALTNREMRYAMERLADSHPNGRGR